MKKLKQLLALGITLGSISIFGLSAGGVSAGSEISQPDPIALLRQSHKPISQGRGWVFSSPSMVVKSGIDARPTSGSSQLCTSVTDSACSPAIFPRMYVKSVLGVCANDAEVACLEAVSTVDAAGVRTPMRFAGGGTDLFPASSSLNVPRGATASRWVASDGNQYMVSPAAQVWIKSVNQQWVSDGIKWFDLYLIRIPASDTSDFVTGNPVGSLQFDAGSRFAVKMRLPSTFPSWFQGRLIDGTVTSSASTSGSTSYEFAGAPVPVAIPTVQLDYAVNPELVTPQGIPNGFEVNGFEPGNSIMSFKSWLSHVDERAITTIQQWKVGSYANTSGTCFTATGGAVGMMSTNAGSYGQEPPRWDSLTNQMTINVGSSHLDENGTLVTGSYSASIPMSVIECLYGAGFVPEQAEINVSYEDGSSTFATSQGVSIVDGRVNISIKGFHYSAPTIGLKLKAAAPVVKISTLKKGATKTLSSIAKTKASQKPKWTASGVCKISGSKLVTLKKSGTCKVTVKVLNTKKKYIVLKTVTYKVK